MAATAAARSLVAKRSLALAPVRTVAIVGGTHGNELAGPALVRFLGESQPELARRPSFSTRCVLSNLKAIDENRRYVSEDLNRCFDFNALRAAREASPENRNIEQQRALELDEFLGPKFPPSAFSSSSQGESPDQGQDQGHLRVHEAQTDFLMDLHNTTSNTGVLLCFHKDDAFAREVAAYLRQFDSSLCTSLWPQEDPPYLPTIARSGMTVEVGPMPHSTMRAEVYEKTKQLLLRALDYVEMHNQSLAQSQNQQASELDSTEPVKSEGQSEKKHARIKVKMPVAERVAEVDYPRDQYGRLTGFIHPKLQGIAELREESFVQQGSPIFQTEAGETLALDLEMAGLDKDAKYYPMFVNEAAYYEKKVAFFLTQIKEHEVEIIAPEQQ